MRRSGGLRRRLLAGIGMLTILFLAVLVLMLLAIHELRSTDTDAKGTATVVIATSRAQNKLQRLESIQREWVERRDPASQRTFRAAIEGADAQLDRVLAALGDRPDADAAAIRAEIRRARAYLDDVARPTLADTTRDAGDLAATLRGEDAIERTGLALNRLLEAQRAALLTRRNRTGSLAETAEVVGIAGIVATLLLVAGCLVAMRRVVLVPLRRVTDAARALAAGDLDARVGRGHGGAGEVAQLGDTFDAMAESLGESRAKLERQNAELERRGAELVDAVRTAREGASVLRTVLDATPDAIALLDREGSTIVDNPPMREVRAAFGERGTAIDEHGTLVPFDAGAGDGDGDAPDGGGEGAGGGETRDEITLLGTRRAFARYVAPVRDGHGRLIGRLLVLREVTGEREAERVKEEFFALVSHELRTPLTAILGYVELVLGEDGGALDEEHRRYLEIVERNSQRLLRLVGDLLFAAQVESGSLLLDPSRVHLAEIAREAVETARPRAEDAGIELSAEIEDVEASIGDRDRLAQVLDNLISNALKFTPSGGRVRVTLAREDGRARLEVSDTGVGVPADEQANLFDRFFRASNATARAVPGVGLGLMIVRAIVAAHRGTIGLESRVGAGTTFTVRLPVGAAATAHAVLDGETAELVPYRDEPADGASGASDASAGGRYR